MKFAQNTSGVQPPPNINQIRFPLSLLDNKQPIDIVLIFINWLLFICTGIAVLAIVYSGVMYIMAGNDPNRAAAAKKNLTWSIIGLVVIMLGLVILNTIKNVILSGGL